MYQDHQFKFYSCTGKYGTAPLDIIYSKILKYLDLSLIPKLQYKIEAQLSDDVFESFIKFINLESIPAITVKNVNEYSSLAQELKFRELEMLVESFIKEQKEREEIIQQLKNDKKRKDTSFFEKLISSNLDYYIENHPDLLSSLELTTLYNIFNSNERFVQNQSKAFEFILNCIEQFYFHQSIMKISTKY